MFKNTTRRGLAIGAAIAVAFSGLVTSPAQAAGEVVFAPSAGTSYNTFVTEGFTLQASLAPGQVAANAVQLKYKIDKAAGATVSYAVSTSAPVSGNLTLNAASTSVVVAADGAGATTQNFIRLNVTGANSSSSTVDVTVTAFLDANNNSTLDAGEFNTPQTVSFKKYSEVATSVVITTPAQLDVTVSGTVAFTGINTDQVQSTRGVVVVLNGTDQASVSATAGTFARGVSALAAASTISAYAVVANHKVGANATTVTVAKNTVGAITASAVAGNNALNASAGAVDARVNSAFAVQANVKSTSTGSAVAGAAVTVAVDALGLSATKTLSLNGTVYTDSAKLPTALAVTSDASGNAVVNVVTAGFAHASTVSFVFKSQNQTADALVVTNKNAVYSATAAGTGFQTVTLSGAIAVALTVADQWKVAAPSNYRVVVSYDGTTKYLPLTAGAVTATFTGTSSASVNDVTVDAIQSQSAVTSNWSSETGGTTTSGAVKVKSTAVAAAFSTAPTHSATTVISRATASPKAGYLNAVTITGIANHAGQSVTLTSGTGVLFSNAAQDTAAVASTYTTNADGNGRFTVSAYVTKAGAATINYVAGTATASTTVTAAAALGNEGTALSIVSVDTILPGKTLVATVKLVDELGNPVAADDASTESFGVTVTGLGFVGSLPTKLNASGEATVTVLLGSADEGNVVITATYDADGTGTAKAAVTATKTVAVAPAAAPEVNAVIGSFNGRWAVRVENAKGSTVVIKVGGRWFKATASGDNFVFSRKSRVGASVLVKVWVAGDLQNEQTITVK
jgi:hypothetical protein